MSPPNTHTHHGSVGVRRLARLRLASAVELARVHVCVGGGGVDGHREVDVDGVRRARLGLPLHPHFVGELPVAVPVPGAPREVDADVEHAGPGALLDEGAAAVLAVFFCFWRSCFFR